MESRLWLPSRMNARNRNHDSMVAEAVVNDLNSEEMVMTKGNVGINRLTHIIQNPGTSPGFLFCKK